MWPGLVMISGTTIAPSLTGIGGNKAPDWQAGFFRTIYNSVEQARGAAVFVSQKLGITRAATINDGDAFTQGFTLVFGLFTLPFAVVSSSVALGLPFLKWKKEPLLVMAICFGYFAPHLLLLAEPRFHLALVAFLTVFAAYTWFNFPALRARMMLGKNWWKLAIALILLALLWFNWGSEIYKDLDKLIPLFGPEGYKTFYVY